MGNSTSYAVLCIHCPDMHLYKNGSLIIFECDHWKANISVGYYSSVQIICKTHKCNENISLDDIAFKYNMLHTHVCKYSYNCIDECVIIKRSSKTQEITKKNIISTIFPRTVCPACNNKKSVSVETNQIELCGTCHGTGGTLCRSPYHSKNNMHMRSKCLYCGYNGAQPGYKLPCFTCKGNKTLNKYVDKICMFCSKQDIKQRYWETLTDDELNKQIVEF